MFDILVSAVWWSWSSSWADASLWSSSSSWLWFIWICSCSLLGDDWSTESSGESQACQGKYIHLIGWHSTILISDWLIQCNNNLWLVTRPHGVAAATNSSSWAPRQTHHCHLLIFLFKKAEIISGPRRSWRTSICLNIISRTPTGSSRLTMTRMLWWRTSASCSSITITRIRSTLVASSNLTWSRDTWVVALDMSCLKRPWSGNTQLLLVDTKKYSSLIGQVRQQGSEGAVWCTVQVWGRGSGGCGDGSLYGGSRSQGWRLEVNN